MTSKESHNLVSFSCLYFVSNRSSPRSLVNYLWVLVFADLGTFLDVFHKTNKVAIFLTILPKVYLRNCFLSIGRYSRYEFWCTCESHRPVWPTASWFINTSKFRMNFAKHLGGLIVESKRIFSASMESAYHLPFLCQKFSFCRKDLLAGTM